MLHVKSCLVPVFPSPQPDSDIVSNNAILSFKKIELAIGALDFISDQEFLEAVFHYTRALPMDDVWQDERWKQKMEYMQVRAAGSLTSRQQKLSMGQAVSMGVGLALHTWSESTVVQSLMDCCRSTHTLT